MGNKSRIDNHTGKSWRQLQRDEPRRSQHVPPFRLAAPADRFITRVIWNSSKAGTFRNPTVLNSQESP